MYFLFNIRIEFFCCCSRSMNIFIKRMQRKDRLVRSDTNLNDDGGGGGATNTVDERWVETVLVLRCLERRGRGAPHRATPLANLRSEPAEKQKSTHRPQIPQQRLVNKASVLILPFRAWSDFLPSASLRFPFTSHFAHHLPPNSPLTCSRK